MLLGTQTGRAVAGGIAKLGGLSILGGLAYKAYKNHQEGKPLTAGVPGLEGLAAHKVPASTRPITAMSRLC